MLKPEIQGDIELCLTGPDALGGDAIRLLEMIGVHGTLAQAAKAVGISYKTAWDLLNYANNCSRQPLALKLPGGAGGGKTCLTPAGETLIRQYRILQEEHRKFLAALSAKLENFSQSLQLFRRISMRLSARNVLTGTVSEVRPGAVNAEVILTLPGGESIEATVTLESAAGLGLKPGAEAYAVIKASAIIVGVNLDRAKLSSRNVLFGRIARLTSGAVNTEVELDISERRTLCAVITRESAERMQLREGMDACAVFKASSVILGVS